MIWLYALALRLYPREFREQHGAAMLQTYSDALKHAKLEGRSAAFHARCIVDFSSSLIAAHLESKGATMPVVPARLMTLLSVAFIAVYLFPALQIATNDTVSLVRSSLFYVLLTLLLLTGFFAAERKPRSQRAFFALTSAGFAIVTALSLTMTIAILQAKPYATVFLAPEENPYMETWKMVVIYGLRWLPITTLLVGGLVSATLRSLEQQRFSRWFTLWLFVAVLATLQFTHQNGAWVTTLRWIAEVVTVGLLIGIAWTYWRGSTSAPRPTA